MKNQQEKEYVLRLVTAVNPSWYNRGDYSNRVKQTERVTVFTEDGTPIEKDVEFFISWESIQAILRLVQQKARLPNDLCISIEQESDGRTAIDAEQSGSVSTDNS